MVRIDSLMKC